MIMIDFRVLVHGLSMALVPLSIVVLAFASAADAPVQLGNDHIGMTSESMAQADGESQDEARVEAALAESEWHSEAPAVGVAPSAVAHDGPAAHNYEDCVELAIRSGNGFRASSSVCQALFLRGFSPAPSQRPTPIATEDEGLLLLTLPPSTTVAEPSTLEAEPEVEPGDQAKATATEEMAEQTAPTEAEETVTPTEVTEAAVVSTSTEAPVQPADETEQSAPTEAPEEPATPSEAEAGAGDAAVVPDESTVAPSEASAETPAEG